MRLGIDFGTTRTVVAAVADGRYPVVSFETEEGFVDALPGLVSVGGGQWFFGADASFDPGHVLLRSVKAAVTGRAPDEGVQQVGDRSALDLVTSYLKYLHRMLREKSNLDLEPGEPLEAMVAVPAQASTRQRYLTLEAFQAAGFEVLGLVNEPTAGAVEFARHTLSALSPRSPKRYVVVYDLGGGTFDAAAVSLKHRRFDLIAAEGEADLGGNAFDEIIARQALMKVGAELSDLGDQRVPFLERCRVAKESLTSSSRRLMIDTRGLLEPDEVIVEVDGIYEECAPLIERSLARTEVLLESLRAHGIDPDNARELGAVYLVGGSVSFPAVQRKLRQRFGRKIQLAPQPYASTAVGLALAADEDAELFVRETPTRHFGVWREEQSGFEKVFDPIIEKHLSVGEEMVVERSYRPAHSVGCLRFVECTELDEARTPRGEVTPWKSILFPYDPALSGEEDLGAHLHERSPLSDQEITETYRYTSSGLIRVSIENRTSGYRREYVLGQDTARFSSH